MVGLIVALGIYVVGMFVTAYIAGRFRWKDPAAFAVFWPGVVLFAIVGGPVVLLIFLLEKIADFGRKYA